MRARETDVIGHDGHSPVPMPRDVLSDEQIDLYLEALEAGSGLDLAARRVIVDEKPMTGTSIRRLLRRDPEVWARVEEAVAEGKARYRDRLRATARQRAETSDRILEVELGTHVPEYDHLRRDRVKVDARVEHAIVIPPDALDQLPLEKLVALRDLLGEIGGEIVDGEARELGPGE